MRQDNAKAEKSNDELLAVTHENLQEIRQSIHQQQIIGQIGEFD